MSSERRRRFLVLLAALVLAQLDYSSAAPQPEVANTVHANQLDPTQTTSSLSTALSPPEGAHPSSTAPTAHKVDKLKRGLASFLNKNNPAAFFVPSAQQVGGLTMKGSSSGSPDSATLINAEPSADTIIKGPNRLAHTRPIGGPLRWGRR